MFTAKDINTQEVFKIDRIEFIDGEIDMVVILHDSYLEERKNGEDLEIYLKGKLLTRYNKPIN